MMTNVLRYDGQCDECFRLCDARCAEMCYVIFFCCLQGKKMRTIMDRCDDFDLQRGISEICFFIFKIRLIDSSE